MPIFTEMEQEISFPDSWEVIKYDGSSHATKTMQNWRFKVRIQRAKVGTPAQWSPQDISQSAIEFLAWIPEKEHLLLIEVKDYRKSTHGGDPVPAELADWVAWKARDTLAGLMVAATDPAAELYTFAQKILKAKKRSVLVDVKWPPSGDAPVIRRKQHENHLRQKLGPLSSPAGVPIIIDPDITAPWTTRDTA
jgi:hypothetical protein